MFLFYVVCSLYLAYDISASKGRKKDNIANFVILPSFPLRSICLLDKRPLEKERKSKMEGGPIQRMSPSLNSY